MQDQTVSIGPTESAEKELLDGGMAADGATRRPGKGSGNGALRLIAGQFAETVSLIWPGSRIGEYFAAPDARRHVWHACLAAESGIFRPTDDDTAEVAYARLARWKGKYLIVQAYGAHPPGLLGALGRLGGKARRPEVYRALVEVMADAGAGAKFLAHAEGLRDEPILAVAALPPQQRSKRLMKELGALRFPAEEAAFFIWCVSRLTALEGPQAAAAVLASPKPILTMQKAYKDLPFPAPPWPGDDFLTPVRSPERLTEIAAQFRNCLSHYATQAVVETQVGLKCFYEWRGAEPALLEFRAWPPFGWRLTEAKGPRNAALSPQTRAAILAALAQCPLFAPVWPTDEAELLRGLEP